MTRRAMRYAIVDLENQTSEIMEITVEHFGTWGAYLNELVFWWEADPSAVVLHTGVLTGSGAPGTGAMTWSYLKNGRIRNVFGEGRLGAYLRYAGVDSMIFMGRSPKPCCISVEAGALSVAHSEMGYDALLANRRTEETVFSFVTGEAVVEDQYFAVADRAVASRMSDKGVRSLIVEASGRLPVADPQRMLALCAELYQDSIRNGIPDTGGRKKPAHFLSLSHVSGFDCPPVYEDPVATREAAVYAALGIIWNSAQKDWKAYTAALISACLGISCAGRDLDALAAHLTRLRRKTVKGGDENGGKG